jgi:hypothetical protein
MLLPIIAVSVVVGLWWLTRTRELFCISVRGGKVLIVRGRVPGGLLSEIAEVMRRPAVKRATVKAMRGEHGAFLSFSGTLDEGRQQRLRNIFALYPASQLRCAPAIKQPTFGQLVGIAWLAWLFDRSR